MHMVNPVNGNAPYISQSQPQPQTATERAVEKENDKDKDDAAKAAAANAQIQNLQPTVNTSGQSVGAIINVKA
jgi:hypothetical protein